MLLMLWGDSLMFELHCCWPLDIRNCLMIGCYVCKICAMIGCQVFEIVLWLAVRCLKLWNLCYDWLSNVLTVSWLKCINSSDNSLIDFSAMAVTFFGMTLIPFATRPAITNCPYQATGLARTAVGRFLLLARLSGTHCPKIFVIESVVLTVTDSRWRHFCFHSTSVFSALEVFFYVNAVYKFTFDIDID